MSLKYRGSLTCFRGLSTFVNTCEYLQIAMALPMFLQALITIQRLDKQQFARLDPLSKWLIITRAAVFIITVLASSVAGRLTEVIKFY